ncbi:MAG: class I SAM-dependent methyltransferase [Hominenteromicrobium sp.]
MNTIREDWNSMAAAYEAFNTSEDSYSYNIEWPCIRDMLPELAGKSVLDVGCGTGIFTFLLEAFRPAELVGVDISEEMLKIAESKAEKRASKAEFLLGDASEIARSVNRRFDFIFSSTTTHYLADLECFFAGVSACLKEDGCCILSVIHPVYSAGYPLAHGDTFPEDDEWQVRYLDQRMRAYIQPWIEYNDDCENRLSRSYHHLFSDYVNAAVRAGLRLQALREPMPPESWKEKFPGRYESFVETPTYMVMKLTKQ